MSAKILLISCLFVLLSCNESKEEYEANVEGFESDDKHMLQAYSDARSSVDDFIKALSEREEGYRYLVKFRVQDGGEVEHMWGEPITYKQDIFSGVLINRPVSIKSVEIGSALRASRDEISDWAILSPNGEFLAGGYTIQVMKNKEGVKPENQL